MASRGSAQAHHSVARAASVPAPVHPDPDPGAARRLAGAGPDAPDGGDGTPSEDSALPGPRSRRALLAATAGGIGAWAAGALTAVVPASAAAGSPLILGRTTNSAGTANTKMAASTSGAAYGVEQKGAGIGVFGYASKTSGVTRGVHGRALSPAGDGVLAQSSAASAGTGSALRALGGRNVGVAASSETTAVSGYASATSGATGGVVGRSVSPDGDGVRAVNDAATSGTGSGLRVLGNKNNGVEASSDLTAVHGTGGYAGLQGNGGSYGGILIGSSVGAYGSGNDYGAYGLGGTYGLVGSGSAYGVYAAGPTGVYGSGSTYGVVGTTTNPNSDAVRGDGGQYGVHGVNARTAGIRGDSGYVGAWGQGTTYGVYGLATDGVNASYGLFGQASNGASYAMYAQGNARVTGTLSKGAGSFQIDHPLDPEHRWLFHSFVESPDMMNVYNGVVDLDAGGRATVDLPAYFAALNRDYRYQLTAIGGPAPDLHVAREVEGNRFAIAGGPANGRVSWQVTGIRQDDYAREHPIVVERAKSADEAGTRAFVPKGSKARPWQPHPVRPTDQPPVTMPKDVGHPPVPIR